jgi:Tol biopolymer transport system component
MKRTRSLSLLLVTPFFVSLFAADAESIPLRDRLEQAHFRIAYETYVDRNWEIFAMDADGSHLVNLTQTPNLHEHYPQISPSGEKICFVCDEGEGRDAVRSLWVMEVDGRNRHKLVEHAREPFWSPDGKTIGFLLQEYPKFNVVDFYTKGMNFYDLTTGQITPHPNSDHLLHLYNPSFARNGKWIAATVHAGMGFSHAIVLIEARGNRVINLNIPGCRPCLSPDGRQIAWGPGDNELAVAPLNLNSDNPSVGPWRMTLHDKNNQIYHIDWSPDSRFVAFSRGPEGRGVPGMPGCFLADYAPIMGVFAPGWNIGVADADHHGVLDLDTASSAEFVNLTTNGLSNKEPSWFQAPQR